MWSILLVGVVLTSWVGVGMLYPVVVWALCDLVGAVVELGSFGLQWVVHGRNVGERKQKTEDEISVEADGAEAVVVVAGDPGSSARRRNRTPVTDDTSSSSVLSGADIAPAPLSSSAGAATARNPSPNAVTLRPYDLHPIIILLITTPIPLLTSLSVLRSLLEAMMPTVRDGTPAWAIAVLASVFLLPCVVAALPYLLHYPAAKSTTGTKGGNWPLTYLLVFLTSTVVLTTSWLASGRNPPFTHSRPLKVIFSQELDLTSIADAVVPAGGWNVSAGSSNAKNDVATLRSAVAFNPSGLIRYLPASLSHSDSDDSLPTAETEPLVLLRALDTRACPPNSGPYIGWITCDVSRTALSRSAVGAEYLPPPRFPAGSRPLDVRLASRSSAGAGGRGEVEVVVSSDASRICFAEVTRAGEGVEGVGLTVRPVEGPVREVTADINPLALARGVMPTMVDARLTFGETTVFVVSGQVLPGREGWVDVTVGCNVDDERFVFPGMREVRRYMPAWVELTAAGTDLVRVVKRVRVQLV
ncbi:hypothetical protein HK101_003320 [Irineochytrium annulatum]|nr:hypothetical protein HK101_003320 [Irineochytrium annulatum]